MMRYRLRTLLIVLAIAPPALALGHKAWHAYAARYRDQVIESCYATGIAHTTTVRLPPAMPGYRYRQARDGGVVEVPVNAPPVVYKNIRNF
jgi:hypothetical protein